MDWVKQVGRDDFILISSPIHNDRFLREIFIQ